VLERFVLGSDADQCCGGVVEVFIEYHGRPARVVVFGAGHVAQALYDLLAPTADSKSDAASLGVVIVDDRTDWNSADRFFHARRIHSWDEGVRASKEFPAATLAVVMTCSHDTDFDLLRMLLAKADRVPAFVGLIGSRSTRACLFGRLVASGIDAEVVQRVVCPVGVGDTGKEPRAVAISIAAQLLMEARTLSDRSPGLGHTAARSDRHG
jgi:xanthine dehydrogenase accessory factor